MSTARRLLRLAAATVALGLGACLTLWAGPDAEALLAPILTHQASDTVWRSADGRLVCWTWRFDKVRAAEVVDAGWTIRADGQAYPYQRVQRIADSFEDGDRLIRRPVRAGQWSRKCIDVPAELAAWPFRITGFAEYRTAWTGRLWAIRQATAEVLVSEGARP